MGHSKVDSLAEPWILLPLIYMLKSDGAISEYNSYSAATAVGDFINALPSSENTYYSELNKFITNLYSNFVCERDGYFLDKTPRYYLIIEEIERVFPDAKFIFLFRNPVHVASSIINTWGKGYLDKLYLNHIDLVKGPTLLSEGYQKIKDKSYALKYEDFIINPSLYVREICQYLCIEYSEDMCDSFFKQTLEGRMGDPTGTKDYKNIDLKPLSKWKETFHSSYRKACIIKYVKGIDRHVLEIQGYEKDRILAELSSLKVSKGLSIVDRYHLLKSLAFIFFKPKIWFGKYMKKWARSSYLN